MIDSLNGYDAAMPEEQYLMLHMHELLSYLGRRGIVSLLTMAQQGVMGDMRSPVDVTYLADTSMLLRFFEANGQVRRAISVLKKRSGPHEDTIRELQVTQDRAGDRPAPAGVPGHPAWHAHLLRPFRTRRVGTAVLTVTRTPVSLERRALVLAPAGRDAAVAVGLLQEAGLAAQACADIATLAAAMGEGCGLVVVTEEALRTTDPRPLVAAIAAQPSWSDIPFVLLAGAKSVRPHPRRNPLHRAAGQCHVSRAAIPSDDPDLHRPTPPCARGTANISRAPTWRSGPGARRRCRRLQAALLQHRAELETLVGARTEALEHANARLRR